MSETKRTELIGKVVSAANNKTITVLVETYRKYSKKYAAHDEKNIAKVGDTVRLLSTRPLSKTKRYELVEILTKSQEA